MAAAAAFVPAVLKYFVMLSSSRDYAVSASLDALVGRVSTAGRAALAGKTAARTATSGFFWLLLLVAMLLLLLLKL
jgi:hypothetical protein